MTPDPGGLLVQQPVQGLRYCRLVREEGVVEIEKSQGCLWLAFGFWCWGLPDGLDFVAGGVDASHIHGESQEVHTIHPQEALLAFYLQAH